MRTWRKSLFLRLLSWMRLASSDATNWAVMIASQQNLKSGCQHQGSEIVEIVNGKSQGRSSVLDIGFERASSSDAQGSMEAVFR